MATKIMYLIDCYGGPHAGTEGQLLQLVQHLDRTRYEPSMTLLRRSEYLERNGFACPVFVLDVPKLASVRAVVRMVRFAFMLRRRNYRLVHCFFNDSSLIAPPFLRLFGIRVLVSRRDMGFWYTRGTIAALRLARAFVDRYVANSHAVKRLVQDSERVAGDKITVIYNGYSSNAGDSLAPATGLPRELLDPVLVIGIVANLRPIKRIETLVEAFATVSTKFPDARLVIIGDTSSSEAIPTLDKLVTLAARLGVRERVIFTGRVENARAYIERLSIAVLCSESEGLSNSIIEYMQAARPIVCTDTGGNPELIQDGHSGFLVPVGDAAALVDRLSRLLSDRDLAHRLGRNAQAAVRSYTHTRMVSEQMACYDLVLQQTRI
jgi:L-malate glycosyltransferase